MLKTLQFVPVQLTLFLVFGILFGFYYELNPDSIFIISLILVLFLFVIYLLSNQWYSRRIYFNAVTYLCFFVAGVCAVAINNQSLQKSHYSHFLNNEMNAVVRITEVLKPGNYNNKYFAEVEFINGKNTSGKVLLNYLKDSVKSIMIDDRFLIHSKFKKVNKPLNPYNFSYKKYLEKQQVYHQLFLDEKELIQLLNSKKTLKGSAANIRKRINSALIKSGFKDNELGVINALLLGQRKEIDKALLEDYASAGAIHILAVSGLHVGIILLILNFLCSLLERLKYGKTIKLIVVVSLLWSFAFVAGLSASVIRAVTMFTAVAIGWQLNKPSNVYNTLIISMFVLLLVHPYFLLDIGFQLSYLAVFSIVWLQPLFYRIWIPGFKIVDYFWKLLTVSLAAQLGILPLSIFYFHQFPGLFFLSNLLIIPILGTILIGGILAITLSLAGLLPPLIAEVYIQIIKLMNSLIRWISNQEGFLFQNITMSQLLMVSIYTFIIFTALFLKNRTAKRFIYLLCTLILIQSVVFYEYYETKTKSEFIIFYKSRKTILAKRNGNRMTVFHNLDRLKVKNENSILNYNLVEGNIMVEWKSNIPKFEIFNKQRILIVDSLGIYQKIGLKPDIVVLRASPRINLARLIAELKPKLIVADGSNYKSYETSWERICLKEKTPFYQIRQKGAFILKK
jgi:competence protein ComEC